jgi:hypothetical protein
MCAELLEADEVRIQSAAADFVAAWLWEKSLSVPGQQWRNKHDRAPDAAGIPAEFRCFKEAKVYSIGLKLIGVGAFLFHLYAQPAQEVEQAVDIKDVGEIGKGDRFSGQEGGTKHLKGFIFGTLWGNVSAQWQTTVHFEGIERHSVVLVLPQR